MSEIQSLAEADRILNQEKVEQKNLETVEKKKLDRAHSREEDMDEDADDELSEKGMSKEEIEAAEIQEAMQSNPSAFTEDEEEFNFDAVENILELPENEFPKFTLAKNKARFLRMVSWYRQKEEWIEVAPVSGVAKLFKQQSKELEGIRSSKLDYEMELETGTLTPSQRSYRRDELKMCRVQEKMAVHMISKLQVKIKSGRR